MGTRKSIPARILTLGCAGLICLGASYTWSGGGTDDDWSNGENWNCTACIGYPDDTADDADIDGIFTVDLINECIDNLTLRGTVTIGDANSDDPVLVANTVIISGDASITITNGATITTDSALCP